MYINAILNGMQGVLVFIVYCYVGKEIRHSFESQVQRRKSAMESSKKSNSRSDHGANNNSQHERTKTTASEKVCNVNTIKLTSFAIKKDSLDGPKLQDNAD